MQRMVITLVTVGTLTAIAATSHAQSLTFSASKGQSAELQTKDSTECATQAVQQSGFNPAQAQSTAAQAPPAAGGERAKGAARGAAVGAAAGAIGGDASKGAAAGAAAGTVAGGARKRQDRRETNAQAQQQQTAAAQGQTAYNNAMSACMQGRGYLVK